MRGPSSSRVVLDQENPGDGIHHSWNTHKCAYAYCSGDGSTGTPYDSAPVASFELLGSRLLLRSFGRIVCCDITESWMASECSSCRSCGILAEVMHTYGVDCSGEPETFPSVTAHASVAFSRTPARHHRLFPSSPHFLRESFCRARLRGAAMRLYRVSSRCAQ